MQRAMGRRLGVMAKGCMDGLVGSRELMIMKRSTPGMNFGTLGIEGACAEAVKALTACFVTVGVGGRRGMTTSFT